jgi:hypothetical protein
MLLFSQKVFDFHLILISFFCKKKFFGKSCIFYYYFIIYDELSTINADIHVFVHVDLHEIYLLNVIYDELY